MSEGDGEGDAVAHVGAGVADGLGQRQVGLLRGQQGDPVGVAGVGVKLVGVGDRGDVGPRAGAERSVARIISVGVDKVVTVPTTQSPLAGSYVPWLGVAETNDRPAGSRSADLDVRCGIGAVVRERDGVGDDLTHVGGGVVHGLGQDQVGLLGRHGGAGGVVAGVGVELVGVADRRRVGLR